MIFPQNNCIYSYYVLLQDSVSWDSANWRTPHRVTGTFVPTYFRSHRTGGTFTPGSDWVKSPPTIISCLYQLNKQVEQSGEFINIKWMFTGYFFPHLNNEQPHLFRSSYLQNPMRPGGPGERVCPLRSNMRPDSLPRLWRYINLLLTYLHLAVSRLP